MDVGRLWLLFLSSILSLATHANAPAPGCAKFEEAAQSGDAAAIMTIAICYWYGIGYEQNKQVAELSLFAAEQIPEGRGLIGQLDLVNHLQGDAAAEELMNSLGFTVLYGHSGFPADRAFACDVFEFAAELGSLYALYNKGLCYWNGWGRFPQDGERAMDTFRTAASAGIDAAILKLARVTLVGRETQRDHSETLVWWKKLANGDSSLRADAAAIVATAYAWGIGQEQQSEEAARWYRQAQGSGVRAAAGRGIYDPGGAHGELQPTPCWFEVPEHFLVACARFYPNEQRTTESSMGVSFPVVLARNVYAPIRGAPILFAGAGGPGSALVNDSLAFQSALAQVTSVLDEGYEVIFADLRGASGSAPHFSCPDLADDLLALYSLPAVEASQQYIDLVTACINSLKASGVKLTEFTSVKSANDLEELRQALGYTSWHALGISYSARLVIDLAARFPNTVQSLILDSPALPTDNRHSVPAYTASAFQELGRRCEQDPKCSAAFPHLPEALEQALEKLRNEPVRRTITALQDGKALEVVIEEASLLALIHSALFDPETAQSIPELIHSVNNGAFDLLDASLRKWMVEDASSGFTDPLFWNTICLEEGHREDSRFSFRTKAMDPGPFIRLFDKRVDDTICELILSNTPMIEVRSDFAPNTPVLALYARIDPVTPFDEAALAELPSTLIWSAVFEQAGHNVLAHLDCAEDVIIRFLDRPDVDPSRLACVSEPASTDWAGVGNHPNLAGSHK